MFSFGRNKKDKKDKTQIQVSSEVVIDQVIKQQVAKADLKFDKPKYNPQSRKTHYDDSYMHQNVKANAFSGESDVRDPYTGSELVHTIKEAKQRFGNEWQDHLAEADHIDPLSQIAKRTESNPWVSSEDIKNIGNDQSNFQILSRRMNQTGGKGGSTQNEWSQNYKGMQQIAEQTGESVEYVTEKVRRVGEAAEIRNNDKIAKTSLKNAAATAHNAGKTAMIYSGGYTATISGIVNIVSCINGEKTTSKALKDVGKDCLNASASGYIKGSGLTTINHILTSSDSEFLAVLGKNNVVGKAITAVSVAGETIVKWGNGEISTGECLVELGDKGCSFGGTYYGAAFGQALIPIPIVGGAVGSFVGGTLASCLYNSIAQEIYAAKEEERRRQQEIIDILVKQLLEQQRRGKVQQLIRVNTTKAVINSTISIIQSGEFQNLMHQAGNYFADRAETERRIAECVLVTLQLYEYRRQLQEYVNNYFAKYEYCFAEALDLMDSALKIGDYNGAIAESNQISKLLGKKPIIENTEDFCSKIFSKDKISF